MTGKTSADKKPYRRVYARNFLSALSRTSCTCILYSFLIFLSSIFLFLSLRPCDNTRGLEEKEKKKEKKRKRRKEADKEDEKKIVRPFFNFFFYLSRFESKAISFEDVIVGMIDNLFLFFFFLSACDLASSRKRSSILTEGNEKKICHCI